MSDVSEKIDKLTELMSNRFDGVEERLDSVESRLGAVEYRQRSMELDIEFLKGKHDFGRFSPYHASDNGYVAREPSPNLDGLQENRDDYEDINPYY